MTPQQGRRDAPTVPPPSDRAHLPALGRDQMRDAFKEARALYAGEPWRDPRPGYRLFWGRHGQLGYRDVTAGEGGYAVIGRHTLADARLAGDPTISLRHLLARVVRLQDGTNALRIFDLHTQRPFFLDTPEPHRSMVACGPFVLRVGEQVIGGVPFEGAAGAETPWDREPPSMLVETSQLPPRTSGHYRRNSWITVLPPPPGLSEVAMVRPSLAGGGQITLSARGRAMSFEIGPNDLELGVLIGRGPRGLGEGMHAVANDSISRPHLLLVAHDGLVEAVDLCSMNGTWAGGKRIRRVELPHRGAELLLGVPGRPVSLVWHPRCLH